MLLPGGRQPFGEVRSFARSVLPTPIVGRSSLGPPKEEAHKARRLWKELMRGALDSAEQRMTDNVQQNGICSCLRSTEFGATCSSNKTSWQRTHETVQLLGHLRSHLQAVLSVIGPGKWMSRDGYPWAHQARERRRLAYSIVHAIGGCKPLQPVHLDSSLKT